MPEDNAVLDAEQSFFDALLVGDAGALERMLVDDFIIIDVMTGSEIGKSDFVQAIAGAVVKFRSINRLEARVRFYDTVAVVTGRTQMEGLFQGNAFAAASRYTHVFAKQDARWKLATAQGTQIVD